MVTKELVNQIGSLEVRPVVDDKFVSDMNIGALKFQLEEAEQSGVAKQIEIAKQRLEQVEKIRVIKDLNYPEVVIARLRTLDEDDKTADEVFAVAITKHREPILPKPQTWWQKYKKIAAEMNYETHDNYYSIFAIEDFPSTIPASALQSYRNVKDKGIFDRFTVWVRGKDWYDACDGAGLCKVVETDPYLIGLIEAIDGKEQDRWFVVDSWNEEEPTP